jgi:hypothetical protein
LAARGQKRAVLVYEKSLDYRAALADYELYLSRFPDDGRIRLRFAQCLVKRLQETGSEATWLEAIRASRKAILCSADPDDEESARRLYLQLHSEQELPGVPNGG